MKLLVINLLLLLLLGLTVAGQETVRVAHIQEPTAVFVGETELLNVSASVLAAEAWLRTHVLNHFPSTSISTIVVGKGVLCNKLHEKNWSLVLPCVKSVYFSLVRWGLAKEIKVSAAFSSQCFSFPSLIKPILSFLQEYHLAYSIDPTPRSSHLSEVAAHHVALVKLGFSQLKDIRVIRKIESLKRKLSSFSVPSFPERPKPIGIPSPANTSQNPKTPSFSFSPVPGFYFSFAPYASPPEIPQLPLPPPPSPSSSDELPPPALPPCFPAPSMAPAPPPTMENGQKAGLWCVAKPTVPAEKLQEAMDYACGEGGANCEEIMPNGKCYYPDNVLAHASYAFNSYWQKWKHSGGSCSFEGTALLINSDPSFLPCHFEIS